MYNNFFISDKTKSIRICNMMIFYKHITALKLEEYMLSGFDTAEKIKCHCLTIYTPGNNFEITIFKDPSYYLDKNSNIEEIKTKDKELVSICYKLIDLIS